MRTPSLSRGMIERQLSMAEVVLEFRMEIITHVRKDTSASDCTCITHVKTASGSHTRTVVFDYVKRGGEVRVGKSTGPKVEAYGNSYIRSEGNGTKSDNLLALPTF